MFWIGIVIGMAVGAVIGIMCTALVVANNRNKRNNIGQARYFAEQKDRNEF